MRGEPLLNPNFLEIVKILREHLPRSKIITTTNGDRLTPELAREYFKIGGNILLIDCYDKKIIKYYQLYSELNPQIVDEPGNKPYTPKTRTKTYLIRNITQTNTPTRKLSNLAGNMTKKAQQKYKQEIQTPLKQICTRPHGELIIFYNGKIGLCCHDGNMKQTLWDIQKGKLKQYWNQNQKLNKIRTELKNGNRTNPLCKQCNYFGGEKNRLKKE